MKQAKPIFVILIMMLICCSYSIGQSSSGFGVNGDISNYVPGIFGASPPGIVNNSVSVYPTSQVSNGAMVYLGDIDIHAINISQLEFLCDLISSCGLYPTGEGDIKTGAGVYPASQVSNGAMVYLGRVRSGATVSL